MSESDSDSSEDRVLEFSDSENDSKPQSHSKSSPKTSSKKSKPHNSDSEENSSDSEEHKKRRERKQKKKSSKSKKSSKHSSSERKSKSKKSDKEKTPSPTTRNENVASTEPVLTKVVSFEEDKENKKDTQATTTPKSKKEAPKKKKKADSSSSSTSESSLSSDEEVNLPGQTVPAPRVSSKPETKKGYLEKKGNLTKKWYKRCFILQNGCLYYFENNTDLTPKGVIGLVNAHVYPNVMKANKTTLCPTYFNIRVNNRDFLLRAPNEQLKHEWIQAIRSNVIFVDTPQQNNQPTQPAKSSILGKFVSSNTPVTPNFIGCVLENVCT
mmetsp:Transcript_7679/g.10596  ORF Transcript_7679/g.10596 Transcript_7679/m.10596 type:complete len:325 (+) Transcript_7679:34-1008(+)